MNAQQQLLFTEIFPIKVEALPHLYSYTLDVSQGDLSTIGGKLVYRLQAVFAGRWAWADRKLVTDTPQEEAEIMPIIRHLWSDQPDIFRGLRGIALEPDKKLSVQGIAEFVVRGLLSEKYLQVRKELDRRRQDLGKAYVERVYDPRPWVIAGQPAVSISISSRMVHKQDCREYALEVGEDELVGLLVADKSSTFKGEVQKIAGHLTTERPRLLALARREEMIQLITDAADEEPVVSVANGHIHPYDYVVGALNIIPRMEDLRRFGINPSQALKAMRLNPDYRAKIVREIAEMVSDPYLGKGYNSDKNPQLFMTAPYSTNIRVGGGKVVTYNEKALLSQLKQYGLYKVADRFRRGNPIRIGILDTLRTSRDGFMGEIEGQLRSLGFDLQVVGNAQVQPRSRAEIDRAVTGLQAEEPDILLAFLPDQNEADDEDDTPYYHLKSLTVGRGLPSQAVEQSTLNNSPYAVRRTG